jgi:hypothetical protein
VRTAYRPCSTDRGPPVLGEERHAVKHWDRRAFHRLTSGAGPAGAGRHRRSGTARVCAPPRGARVRTSPPIELRLQPAPTTLACAREECPCCWLDGDTSCRARFFRGHLPLTPSDRVDDLWDAPAPDLVEDAA